VFKKANYADTKLAMNQNRCWHATAKHWLS